MNKIFIYSGRVARDLIRNHFKLIDIAENQSDKKRSVFIFESADNLIDYLKANYNIHIQNTL